jgi:hypothetical protein
MSNVLISHEIVLQHVQRSDISGDCYYSMFNALISQEIVLQRIQRSDIPKCGRAEDDIEPAPR